MTAKNTLPPKSKSLLFRLGYRFVDQKLEALLRKAKPEAPESETQTAILGTVLGGGLALASGVVALFGAFATVAGLATTGGLALAGAVSATPVITTAVIGLAAIAGAVAVGTFALGMLGAGVMKLKTAMEKESKESINVTPNTEAGSALSPAAPERFHTFRLACDFNAVSTPIPENMRETYVMAQLVETRDALRKKGLNSQMRGKFAFDAATASFQISATERFADELAKAPFVTSVAKVIAPAA